MRTIFAAIGMLVLFFIGLIGGLGAGEIGHQLTTTTTSIQTVTDVGPTSTIISAATSIVTYTLNGKTTVTTTVTSLDEGPQLINFSASGSTNSQPFTATTVNAIVNFTVSSGDAPDTSFYWYIYPVNNTDTYVANGGVNAETGPYSSFVYGLTPGQQYFIEVDSANCYWSIAVSSTS